MREIVIADRSDSSFYSVRNVSYWTDDLRPNNFQIPTRLTARYFYHRLYRLPFLRPPRALFARYTYVRARRAILTTKWKWRTTRGRNERISSRLSLSLSVRWVQETAGLGAYETIETISF